jgi:flagellar basal body-associated protein FliL
MENKTIIVMYLLFLAIVILLCTIFTISFNYSKANKKLSDKLEYIERVMNTIPDSAFNVKFVHDNQHDKNLRVTYNYHNNGKEVFANMPVYSYPATQGTMILGQEEPEISTSELWFTLKHCFKNYKEEQ